ncbi:MAG: hypothetical protein H6741_34030, partial [Alphaproteobacteria bacterium]|nr:hypothetical protein [Alphaproteobacteria bacterium]
MDRLRSHAARARHLARRAQELWPLTTAGAVAAACCVAVGLHVGLGQQDLLLVVLAGLGLTLVGLALLSVCAAAGVIALSLRRLERGRPLILECGHAGISGFTLPSLWWLPLVQLRWTWLDARAEVSLRAEGRRLHEQVTASRRGQAERIERLVVVEEPFGFARITLRHRETRALYFR